MPIEGAVLFQLHKLCATFSASVNINNITLVDPRGRSSKLKVQLFGVPFNFNLQYFKFNTSTLQQYHHLIFPNLSSMHALEQPVCRILISIGQRSLLSLT